MRRIGFGTLIAMMLAALAGALLHAQMMNVSLYSVVLYGKPFYGTTGFTTVAPVYHDGVLDVLYYNKDSGQSVFARYLSPLKCAARDAEVSVFLSTNPPLPTIHLMSDTSRVYIDDQKRVTLYDGPACVP